MKDQLSMFAAPIQPPPTQQSERRPENIRASEPQSDVRRIVQHVAGTFIELKEGKPTGREYQIVELHDGSFWQQFIGGERIPAHPLEYMRIHDGLKSGMFVVVEVAS